MTICHVSNLLNGYATGGDLPKYVGRGKPSPGLIHLNL
jgi:hypothetical protein